MIKVILAILLITLLWSPQSPRVSDWTKRTEHLEVCEQGTINELPPFYWTDEQLYINAAERLNPKDARQRIVLEAHNEALRKLFNCVETNVYKLIQFQGIGTYGGIRGIEAEYSQIQPSAFIPSHIDIFHDSSVAKHSCDFLNEELQNAIGSSVNRRCAVSVFQIEGLIQDIGLDVKTAQVRHSVHSTNQWMQFQKGDLIYETFKAKIKIYPYIFESRAFYMRSESRWAKTPVEAVQYLILHEYGHLESFLNRESETMRKDGDYQHYCWNKNTYDNWLPNSEESADQFASSLYRCR